MLHVRIVAPPELAGRVLDYLLDLDTVINVVHFPGAARKPDGDVIMCDVAREQGSVILGRLNDFGCPNLGSVTVDTIGVSLSGAAREAEKQAAGSAADAVLWEEVTAHTSESAELSVSFLLFMVLAGLIGAVGIVTDSVVLIIGATIVSPEFGPLAGLCVAVVQRRPEVAARSAVALVIGFAASIASAMLLSLILVRVGLVAPNFASAHPQTLFISRPDTFAVLVAAFAGVAGMLSLSTSKPGALIGVFISVTTLPAAANIGVATAVAHGSELRGAALQLAINLAAIVVAGIATLGVQRLAFVRRVKASLRAVKAKEVHARPRRPV